MSTKTESLAQIIGNLNRDLGFLEADMFLGDGDVSGIAFLTLSVISKYKIQLEQELNKKPDSIQNNPTVPAIVEVEAPEELVVTVKPRYETR
jgi:hypothetical protein